MESKGLIPGFQALDGCNCLSASLHRILFFHGYDLSEKMLLALGAGVGFGFFSFKGTLPFIGGRANVHDYHIDLAARTGLGIELQQTTSVRKAQNSLLESLERGEPVCIYVDMAYLPYLGLPEDAHFGEHAVVVAGYDGQNGSVWIADHDPQTSGLKKGGLFPVRLEDLAPARSSRFRPFPPRNRWFVIHYAQASVPGKDDILASIRQSSRAMLIPPIRNQGVAGIKKAAGTIHEMAISAEENFLRAALHNFFIYIEVGGTGGGLFRYMYARFLSQASTLLELPVLMDLSRQMKSCGDAWRTAATPLKDAFKHPDPRHLAVKFAEALEGISALEYHVWNSLDMLGDGNGERNTAV